MLSPRQRTPRIPVSDAPRTRALPHRAARRRHRAPRDRGLRRLNEVISSFSLSARGCYWSSSHVFKKFAQDHHARPDSAFDCTQRLPEFRGDFTMAEIGKERQFDRLTLFRMQILERGTNVIPTLKFGTLVLGTGAAGVHLIGSLERVARGLAPSRSH